jgi:transposase InsO family protein
MIRDRDRIYAAIVTRRLRAMGIRDRPIAPASPWQNGIAEQLIGSIRRECVVRDGFQTNCQHCNRLITFDTGSEYRNIRRALMSAKEVRFALEAARPKTTA